MNTYTDTLLVIIGISGDLSTRKLLPAIERIAQAGAVDSHFSILGVTRQHLLPQDVLSSLPEQFAAPFLQKNLHMHQMDVASAKDYDALKTKLVQFQKNKKQAQILFYLSIPPQVSQPVIELLGTSGIAALPHVKLLLEKPFGTDLESAKELVSHAKKHFTEQQMYRIDHYLAKEMAQNLLVFKDGNSLFKRTWNKDFIENITITASEKIGIEGRANFYEQTGALRDVVQSHLLQLLALTLMKTPGQENAAAVPKLRLEALKQVNLVPNKPLQHTTIRGQYKNYRTEVQNSASTTETFVQLQLISSDPNWQGVPITIATGKGLHAKKTEIRITYKKTMTMSLMSLLLRCNPTKAYRLCYGLKYLLMNGN